MIVRITILLAICLLMTNTLGLAQVEVSQKIGKGEVTITAENWTGDLKNNKMVTSIVDTAEIKPWKLKLTEQYKLNKKLSLPNGEYTLVPSTQNDRSTVIFVFDKNQDLTGTLVLPTRESNERGEGEELEFVDNFLRATNNDQEYFIEFKQEASGRSGSWCCANHTPAHCGDVDELADLTSQHGCKGFANN